jgi:VanZ family protein
MSTPPPRTARKRLATFWAVGWTLLVLVGCWTPSQQMPEEEVTVLGFAVPNLDKVVHATMFAGFGFLWMHAGPIDRRRAAWVLGLGLALAALTEAGQALPIVDRDANLGDLAADTAGLVLAIGGVILMERRARPAGSVAG